MQLAELGEFGFIERIKHLADFSAEDLVVGIGDDTAVFKSSQNLTLLATDTLIEGVHFDRDYFSFFQIGWRAMAANLSDIAAMGGYPKYALVSLGLPRNVEVELLEELYRGLKELGDKHDTQIVGGDTTASPDRIYISVTVAGEVEPENLTCRSGAKIGDSIFVTGYLGGAEAGLKILQTRDASLQEEYTRAVANHIAPEPRLAEAQFLVENFPIHAMIDVSDGLASEVHHICKSSEVGAKVYAVQIPIAVETNAIALFCKDEAIEYALYGGEDYELLFAAPQESARELSTALRSKFGLACTKIGDIQHHNNGILLIDANGGAETLSAKGFDHFR